MTQHNSTMSNFILWEDLKRRYGERKFNAKQATSRAPRVDNHQPLPIRD